MVLWVLAGSGNVLMERGGGSPLALIHWMWKRHGEPCSDKVLRRGRLSPSPCRRGEGHPPLSELPVSYQLGTTLPYKTTTSCAAAQRLFEAPCVVGMADPKHFMFTTRKRPCVLFLTVVCGRRGRKTGGARDGEEA